MHGNIGAMTSSDAPSKDESLTKTPSDTLNHWRDHPSVEGRAAGDKVVMTAV